MSNQNSERSAAMVQAVGYLQEGRAVEAEETMLARVKETEERGGKESAEHRVAQNELGSILMNAGQPGRAIEAFRAACEGPLPADKTELRDRLTFLMNLGSVLEMSGELDEAAEVLQQGLAGRLSYYGRKHPGYAFGLEPLASVALRQGRTKEALAMLEEVVENFWENGHERVAGALVLRAEAYKVAELADYPFADLDALPNEIIEAMGQSAISRVGEAPFLISRAVLADLLALLVTRLGEANTTAINTLISITNVERQLGDEGDAGIRVEATRRLIGVFDRKAEPQQALDATQALALALDAAGRKSEGIAAYEDALSRAERTGSAALRSQVHRNLGLALAEEARRDEAEKHLRAAMSLADEPRSIGRAEIALALFLQHGKRSAEARELIVSGMKRLDPADPDSLCGRAHLKAIDGHSKDCCGDQERKDALCEAFQEFVLARTPTDLFERLTVGLGETDFEITVNLKREPAEDEVEHLNRLIMHAKKQFSDQLSARY